MDTRSKAASPVIKKKASPSTLRRNARRREEYLQRKKNPSKVKSTEEVETVSDALSCDQCDYKPASEKGLKQHKRMKHKPPQPKESFRQSEEGSASLSASPLHYGKVSMGGVTFRILNFASHFIRVLSAIFHRLPLIHFF